MRLVGAGAVGGSAGVWHGTVASDSLDAFGVGRPDFVPALLFFWLVRAPTFRTNRSRHRECKMNHPLRESSGALWLNGEDHSAGRDEP